MHVHSFRSQDNTVITHSCWYLALTPGTQDNIPKWPLSSTALEGPALLCYHRSFVSGSFASFWTKIQRSNASGGGWGIIAWKPQTRTRHIFHMSVNTLYYEFFIRYLRTRVHCSSCFECRICLLGLEPWAVFIKKHHGLCTFAGSCSECRSWLL